MSDVTHETIWLQPWCADCDKARYGSEGRTWCQDNVYDPCEECGKLPVKYVIAADQPSPQATADHD